MPDPAATRRVVVWTRDLSPPPDDPRHVALDRLRALEERGELVDVSVRVCGKAVVASGNGAPDDTGLTDRIAAFDRWAERTGHSLEPAFVRSERSTMISEDEVEVVRLPLQCVELREEGELVAVFPCTADGETWTVGECLDRLEAGVDLGGRLTEATGVTTD